MRKKKAAVLGAVIGAVLAPILLFNFARIIQSPNIGGAEVVILGPIAGALAGAVLGWFLGSENGAKH